MIEDEIRSIKPNRKGIKKLKGAVVRSKVCFVLNSEKARYLVGICEYIEKRCVGFEKHIEELIYSSEGVMDSALDKLSLSEIYDLAKIRGRGKVVEETDIRKYLLQGDKGGSNNLKMRAFKGILRLMSICNLVIGVKGVKETNRRSESMSGESLFMVSALSILEREDLISKEKQICL